MSSARNGIWIPKDGSTRRPGSRLMRMSERGELKHGKG